jgi:hypothetical protein
MDQQDWILLVCIAALVLIYVRQNDAQKPVQTQLINSNQEQFEAEVDEDVEDEDNSEYVVEGFNATSDDAAQAPVQQPVQSQQPVEQPATVVAANSSTNSTMASVAHDGLTATDLLPSTDSAWAGSCPEPSQNMDYATAMCNVGMLGMTSQVSRNPNLQLRAEVPNPQIQVSPWNMTTITAGNGQGLQVESC